MGRQQRTVIIADPDREALIRLKEAVSAQGHRTVTAEDGSQALEVAILHHPDLVIFDSSCEQIGVRKFFQILRANPATETIPLLVTSDAPIDDLPQFHSFRDTVLIKPYNLDELTARVESVLERQSRARDLSGEAPRLEGDLEQIGLPDLLQVLGSNRRSGTLVLTGPRGRGKILIADGELVHAETGTASGEKALYRLLFWTSGQFTFNAGLPSGVQTLHGSLEGLLMEGMRQNDELARLAETLPAAEEPLTLNVPADGLPVGLHPITEEVVALLDQARDLQAVLDGSPATDFETAQALLALLGRGLLQRSGRRGGTSRVLPLLPAESLLALKGRLRNLYHGPLSRRSMKVLLLAAERRVVLRFIDALAVRPGFQRDRRLASRTKRVRRAIGTVGTLPLDAETDLVLWSAPAEAGCQPLWRPFLDGTVGVVFIVEPGEGKGAELLYQAYDYFFGELGLPAAVVTMSDQPSIEEHHPFLAELPLHEGTTDGCVGALGAICLSAVAERVEDSHGDGQEAGEE